MFKITYKSNTKNLLGNEQTRREITIHGRDVPRIAVIISAISNGIARIIRSLFFYKRVRDCHRKNRIHHVAQRLIKQI